MEINGLTAARQEKYDYSEKRLPPMQPDSIPVSVPSLDP
jgi:hypothetical protein